TGEKRLLGLGKIGQSPFLERHLAPLPSVISLRGAITFPVEGFGFYLACSFSWGCSFGVTLQIGLDNPYPHDRIPYTVVPMLVSTVFVDSVITSVTLFYLVRSKKGFNPQ
ncbi:unnamed protein product, partial [Rhizoctonia solani]